MLVKRKILNHNSIRIDSLRIRLPLNLADNIDISIFDTYSEINNNTAEIDTEVRKSKHKEFFISETRKVKLSIKNVRVSDSLTQECLIILLNSKFIGSRYFDGIFIENIHDIYLDLMSLNAFHVDFETFLQLECTDIDIKFDEEMNQNEWNLLLNSFKRNTKASPHANKGYIPFPATTKEPLQNGLQYSDRKKATISRPFMKLYWKGGELLSNSLDFYNENLIHLFNEENITDVVRIEATIKNKNHASSLGIKSTKLISLLKLSESELENAFRQIIGKYIDNKSKLKTLETNSSTAKITANTQIILNSLSVLLYDLNLTIECAVSRLTDGLKTRQTKSKKKIELMSIYETHLKGTKEDQSNNNVNSFFNKFSWFA